MQLHWRWLVVVLVLLLGGMGLTLPRAEAGTAGTWYVTLDGADSHDCLTPATPCASVNAVLAKPAFAAGDTILLEEGEYRSTTEVGSFIEFTQPVTLSGGWNRAFAARVYRSHLKAYGITGILVAEGVTVTLRWIQVRGGSEGSPYAPPGKISYHGLEHPRALSERPHSRQLDSPITLIIHPPLPHGGIHNRGMLRLENSAAGARSGFGIYNEGTLLLVDSGVMGDWDSGIVNYGHTSLTANSSVSNGLAPSCGGIRNYGTLTMTNSEIAFNHAYEWVGGGLCNLGSATLRDSSVAFNSAYYPYEGIPAEAAGIYNYGALTLTNMLVHRNEAQGRGGGLYNLGQVWLFNSTFTHNIAQDGAGLTNLPSGHITLTHTLLANNILTPPDGQGADCLGTVRSTGYNLLRDPVACDFYPTPSDLVDRDPLLFWRSLPPFYTSEDHLYHPLLYQSPAIDAGDPTGCRDESGALLLTDARGTPRWGACDIGAYEWHPDFDPLHYQLLPVLERSE